MAVEIGRKLSAKGWFLVAYLVLALSISTLVGVVTTSVGWAALALGAVGMPANLCRYVYERSLR
jgi:hypothetical protein